MSSPFPSDPPPKPGLGELLFHGSSWIAAIVRVVVYVLVLGVLVLSASWVIAFFHRPGLHLIEPYRLFLSELVLALCALTAALVLSLLENRRPGVYGLPLQAAFGGLFWQGVLAGLVEISVLIGLIAAAGGYSLGGLAVRGIELVRWGVFWAVLFVLVGVFEEFLFRGYAQYTLGSSVGFWPAAVLLSAIFGAVHIRNAGESWVGALSVVVVGLFLCLTLRRTGNLWFAVGLHASFDFGETFLYSVPNSGFVAEGHLSNATLHGPAWLTGGTVGPEGSVFSFLTIGLLAYVVHRLYPAKDDATDRT